jgi:hypothetical protein
MSSIVFAGGTPTLRLDGVLREVLLNVPCIGGDDGVGGRLALVDAPEIAVFPHTVDSSHQTGGFVTGERHALNPWAHLPKGIVVPAITATNPAFGGDGGTQETTSTAKSIRMLGRSRIGFPDRWNGEMARWTQVDAMPGA